MLLTDNESRSGANDWNNNRRIAESEGSCSQSRSTCTRQMTEALRRYFCLATKVARSNCAGLLNHRIRLDQHVLRYDDTNFTRSLQVDENFEF